MWISIYLQRFDLFSKASYSAQFEEKNQVWRDTYNLLITCKRLETLYPNYFRCFMRKTKTSSLSLIACMWSVDWAC